jgi:hypothetical protein
MFREDKIPQRISLDDVGTIERWALAGLAALARRNGGAALEVVNSRVNEAGRFASAVGFEDVLFTGVRLSWALQVPIYVENAAPSVAAGLRLVDNYARGG